MYGICCLSSCSYIKPQRSDRLRNMLRVVYHLVPTSNHNPARQKAGRHHVVYHLVPTSNHNSMYSETERNELFIILFLHQTTTMAKFFSLSVSCLSSCSYIKPQLGFVLVVILFGCLSSCSYIKPQQVQGLFSGSIRCLSSCSYIKPQLGGLGILNGLCCLSSCSYIKPQLFVKNIVLSIVVYHLVPTSNHNYRPDVSLFEKLFIILFLHQTTTQAISAASQAQLFIILFLHQTTTDLDSIFQIDWLFIILFLHQTTTSETHYKKTLLLFIILFLHQTTTLPLLIFSRISCLSSCSYIKPQLKTYQAIFSRVVYHLVPTSNHNCGYCYL